MKTSKPQLESAVRYQAKHKADVYRNQTKSKAKKFIRDFARKDELIELKEMIERKLNNDGL